MGYFNVVQPCVVAGKHYVRPTVQPIEVDDTVAAPLVESGHLEPYAPGLDALAPGAEAAAKSGLEIANRTIKHVGEKMAEAQRRQEEAIQGSPESHDGEPTSALPSEDLPAPDRTSTPRRARGRRHDEG